MTRTLGLAALVLVGLGLYVLIEPPYRPTSQELVRGARVLGTRKRVEALRVTIREHTIAATREGHGWRIATGMADRATAEALDALATLVGEVRAVDAFRGREGGGYGLTPPQGTLEVTVAGGGRRTLALGSVTASGGSVYAQRDGHRRVFVVGVYLISAIERVLGARDAAATRGGA